VKSLEHSVIQIGAWRVDPALDEISKDGQTTKLEPKMMQLLLCLAAHAGQVVSVEQLLDEVWKDVVVTPDSVYHAVAALRRVLGDDSKDPSYIANVLRRGYRLIAPVVPLDLVEPPPAPPQPPYHDPEHQTAPGQQRPPLPLRWRVLGFLSLIAVTLALGLVVDKLVLQRRTGAGQPLSASTTLGDKSIAVLPFLDLSAKKDQEYFADGMAEEVIDLLARVSQLKVIARSSSFQFKGRSEDARAIGAQLGVAYVLEGALRKSGDEIRVTAQLIAAEDGTHRWSGTYDRNASDILRVQSEIATSIARALQLTIAEGELRPHIALRSPEAYSLYLKGRQAVDRYDRTGLEEGIADFQEALRLDPSLAPAATWLASTYINQGEIGFEASSVMEHAREAAELALRLDPKSATAHALLAEIHINYDWDWVAAEREIKESLALEPHNVWGLFNASALAYTFGRYDEAARYANQAIAISPLEQILWANLAVIRVAAGRFDDAEVAVRKGLEITPRIAGVHWFLGTILLLRGSLETARAEIEQESEVGFREEGLALLYHAMGQRADSDRALARATTERGNTDPMSIADIHAFRGETDLAFSWLERAYAQKALNLSYIKADPFLKSIERNPRFKALLKKMNLPE
jgi:TolB-like protein/DNA-binding winged helix-turn-helix (wHTH) protein/Tfp pilus assembly protein PilF